MRVLVVSLVSLVWGRICSDPNTSGTDFNISALTCGEVFEFLSVHSGNVAESESVPTSTLLGLVHLVGTLFNLRAECVTESARFVASLLIQQSLDHLLNNHTNPRQSVQAFHENVNRLSLTQESPSEYFTHEHDGRLTTLEAMRIKTFHEQQLSHLCLLRFAILNVFVLGERVIEVRSGPEAVHYTWLNKTGLVESFAVDDFPNTEFVSQGNVRYVNFTAPVVGIDRIDWIWSTHKDVNLNLFAHHVRPKRGIISEDGSFSSPDYSRNEALSDGANGACNVTSVIHIYTSLS